ncbi:hypothetical protein SKAU_G00308900 [Synaphobranchus kaupii]|uniref:Uncharacterized protein n=1 Tax=Synaphobranchus kaupii TaxID=118154 RepID=A0A9Q1ER72_SYNKA|nr:hypothetical protein SKAU_G00308900 [Synaphobranchus kaupii]
MAFIVTVATSFPSHECGLDRFSTYQMTKYRNWLYFNAYVSQNATSFLQGDTSSISGGILATSQASALIWGISDGRGLDFSTDAAVCLGDHTLSRRFNMNITPPRQAWFRFKS